MNESLTAAYRKAGAGVPDYADASRAIDTARRRRTVAALTAPLLVAIVVVGGLALGVDRTSDTALTPPATQERSPEPVDALSSPVGPNSLWYRSCTANGCTIRTLANGGRSVDLADSHPRLTETLADDGLADVTLSYDGNWLGVSAGADFTLHELNGRRTIGLPAGPPGTTWRPYYWMSDSFELVLAQHDDDAVLQYAIIHTSEGADPTIERVPAPAEPTLVPAYSSFFFVNLVQAVDPSAAPSERPTLSSLSTWRLFTEGSTQLQPPGQARDLSGCMRPGETLAGPDGAPLEFTAAPATSTEQLTAIVVFNQNADELVPSGIIRGVCEDAPYAAPEGQRRYDLPQSDETTSWTLFGPVTHRWSLMGRVEQGSERMQLVVVGYRGQQQAVGEIPAKAEVLMAGVSNGLLG